MPVVPVHPPSPEGRKRSQSEHHPNGRRQHCLGGQPTEDVSLEKLFPGDTIVQVSTAGGTGQRRRSDASLDGEFEGLYDSLSEELVAAGRESCAFQEEEWVGPLLEHRLKQKFTALWSQRLDVSSVELEVSAGAISATYHMDTLERLQHTAIITSGLEGRETKSSSGCGDDGGSSQDDEQNEKDLKPETYVNNKMDSVMRRVQVKLQAVNAASRRHNE